MSAHFAASERMTVQEFFSWTERQPAGRYELVDGVPVAMSPERNIHAIVKAAVYRALRRAVREAGLDCLVLLDGPTVVIDSHQSRQPDVVVQQGAEIDLDAMTVDAPAILVEVTSPSTMRTDTDDKLIEYFTIPSVRHYVLVHPHHRQVVHHRWVEEGSIATTIKSRGLLAFDPPGFSVSVEDFFAELGPGRSH